MKSAFILGVLIYFCVLIIDTDCLFIRIFRFRSRNNLLKCNKQHSEDKTIGTNNRSNNDEDKDLIDINSIMSSNDDNIDADGFQESIMDKSIQNAVKNYLEEAPKRPIETPVETFNKIYKDIKSKEITKSNIDAKAILETLFPQEKVKEPFDERKVLIKLRSILDQEDFASMFKDPIVGEIL